MLILYMLHVFSGDEWQGSSSHIIMYNTIAGSHVNFFNPHECDRCIIEKVSDLNTYFER